MAAEAVVSVARSFLSICQYMLQLLDSCAPMPLRLMLCIYLCIKPPLYLESLSYLTSISIYPLTYLLSINLYPTLL